MGKGECYGWNIDVESAGYDEAGHFEVCMVLYTRVSKEYYQLF